MPPLGTSALMFRNSGNFLKLLDWPRKYFDLFVWPVCLGDEIPAQRLPPCKKVLNMSFLVFVSRFPLVEKVSFGDLSVFL